MVLDFIEILKVIFLGIVEGITEWLPISSTGHMILVDEFITLNMSEAFKEMFFVVIQLGAILAVVVMFWNQTALFHHPNSAAFDSLQFIWKLYTGNIHCIPCFSTGCNDFFFNKIFQNSSGSPILYI